MVSWNRLVCVRSLLAFTSPKILRLKTGRQYIAIWRTSSWESEQLWFWYDCSLMPLHLIFLKIKSYRKKLPSSVQTQLLPWLFLVLRPCHLLMAMKYLCLIVGCFYFFMRGYNYKNPSSIFLLVFTIEFGQFNLLSYVIFIVWFYRMDSMHLFLIFQLIN